MLKEEYDAVILLGNMYFITNWIVMILSKLKGFKVLQWTHGLLKPDKGVVKRVRSLYYRMSDGMLLYGHRAIDLLTDIGVKREGLSVIYNSLDYEEQRKIIDEFQGSESPWKRDFDLRCIFTGRLREDRRIDVLIEAIALLKSQSFEVGLLIVGGGPLESELQGIAREKGCLENVIFYGNCYEEKVLCGLFSNSDLCGSRHCRAELHTCHDIRSSGIDQ